MKYTLRILVALGLALSLRPLAAAQPDLSGTWVAKWRTPVGEIDFVLRLRSGPGGHLTGFLSSFMDAPIRDGRVAGNDVQLSVETESAGVSELREVKGQLEGQGLRLDISSILPRRPPPAGAQPSRPAASGPPVRIPTLRPLLFLRGAPTASYRPDPVDYHALPPEPLPQPRDLPPNGLERTPPMGWNSWNRFQTHIDDKTVRAIADALVSSGMRDAGYLYINIDDGWEGRRDAAGVLHPNPNFPDMKALADYVHSKGLKLGLYSSPGPRTCAGFEGSYGHEALDAATWARWGIDYLKYDWCSALSLWPDSDMRAVYQRMGEAIAAAGRPMVFSLCQYGRAEVQQWGPRVAANLWRTTGDIADRWSQMMGNILEQDRLAASAGPGHWNDPDMLEIGNGGMTADEYRTHLSLWAIAAAPLIAGNDLRTMDAVTRTILTNAEVIGVDQDPLGLQGRYLARQGMVDIWERQLSGGAYALALVNRDDTSAQVGVTWSSVGLRGAWRARDLWQHTDLGVLPTGETANIPAHGVVMLRLSP